MTVVPEVPLGCSHCRAEAVGVLHLQGVASILWTTNAKLVGIIYLSASIGYGISGLLMSWILRGELCGLGEQLLFGDHQLYNTLTTSGSGVL